MSVAQDMRKAGFLQLLHDSGEKLLFRTGAFCAVVNRGLDAPPVDFRAGQMEFTDRNQTIIEFLQDQVEVPPRVGEYFEDDCGDYHRIKIARRSDVTWRCLCELDSPESDE